MTVKVVLEPGEDNWIVAECPALPGCITQGRTEEEALRNVREAVELWLDTESQKHLPGIREHAKVLELTL